MNKQLLRFTEGNNKLQDGQFIFSIPAGHTCPSALACLSKADRTTGKTTDGPQAQFRCYAASLEAVFPKVREILWNNFDLIRACKDTSEIQSLILRSIPTKAKLIRIHSHGDFFNQSYFDAWMLVALACPHITFYCYTKSIKFVIERLGVIPENFKINASYGGKDDGLIEQYQLKHVKIVTDEKEADFLGMEIDKDDKHAWLGTKSFALLIHGNGPKGSIQAKKHYEKTKASRDAKKQGEVKGGV